MNDFKKKREELDQPRQQPPGPIMPKISLEEFAKVAGADKIDVVDNEQIKERLGLLLAGKEGPSNEFVAYLVEQLRSGNNEFRMVQQHIQEVNGRLAQLQKRAIQLQGEQNKYVKDITAWMDRDIDKSTGEEKPRKEDTDE